jgi:hypothetical protein
MRASHLLAGLFWVAAIAVAQGLTAPAAAVAEVRALHEKVLRAHRESNVEILLEDEAADYVVASRGVITRPTIQQRRERLGTYLRASTFAEYRDLVEPVVSVSADSTLGWVVVQVTARGKQKASSGEEVPIAFTSAWIELYEKRAGRWQRTGNVSNFKP